MNANQPDPDRGSNFWFAWHLLLFLMVLLLALWRHAPTAPQDRDAPANEFSAGRVHAFLQRLIPSNVTHGVGTADHDRVRDEVAEAFDKLGLEVEIQRTFAVNARNHGANVDNIVARLPGRDGRDALLLAAHYDSVPAGPGVSDDGSGVGAILEVARILVAQPRPQNDVIFLISDAEEFGLIGATGFVAEHALADKIRVLLNWEARGSRGPSVMFETGPNNLALIRAMAGHCRRSVSTSLFPAIYNRLSNDTDLTVFKRRGVAGMNFAFIGGWPHYHTPLDNLSNMSLGSVQHQGDHFLRLARVLSQADLDRLEQDDAIYFDVLGWVTLWWPQAWNMAFAGLVLVLALLAAGIALRRERPSGRAIVAGLAVVPLVLLIAAVGGEAARWFITAVAGDFSPSPARPEPMVVALWSLGIVIPLALGRWTAQRGIPARIVATGVLLWWAGSGLALARLLPGASYLLTVPAAVAGSMWLVTRALGLPWQLANLTFLVSAALLWLPVARGLIDALGLGLAATQTIPLAMIGLLAAPTMSVSKGRPWLLLALGLVTAVALAVAPFMQPFSESWPQPVSLVHYEDLDAGQAIVQAYAERGRLPASLRERSRLLGLPRLPVLFHRRPSDTAFYESELAGLPAPVVELLGDETAADGRRRQVKLQLRPAAGQQAVVVVFEMRDEVRNVRANGWQIANPAGLLVFHVAAETGVVLELDAVGVLRLRVAGLSYGLPETAASISASRPPWSVPSGLGDHALVYTRVEL